MILGHSADFKGLISTFSSILYRFCGFKAQKMRC